MRWLLVVVLCMSCTAQLHPGTVDHTLPRAAPAGLDPDAIDHILARAAAEHSSAIVIVKDGKIVVETYRDGYHGGPITAMSASKSIVSMAIGKLISDHKLALDTRVAELLPDWNVPMKDAITIRQLLSHTSGLDPNRTDWKLETIIEHATKAKVIYEPGSRFQYNNDGVDLLAAIVKRVAGMPLDVYVEANIFEPLEIVGAHWGKDKAGTPRGAGELVIRPVDLAKLGQLMLDGGRWNGKQILPAEWVASSTEISQPFNADYGYLWWRDGDFADVLTEQVLAQWHDAGIGAEIIEHARPLVGKRFANATVYRKTLAIALGALDFATLTATIAKGDHVPLAYRAAIGPAHGFSARGWLGQYLVVIPGTRVVAVRMRASERGDYHHGPEHDGYESFPSDVWQMAR